MSSSRDFSSSFRIRGNKHKNIFDIDFNTFLQIKRQFPENQVSIGDRVVGKIKVKYGMPINDLIHILAKFVELDEAKKQEVRLHIDRLDPQIITWKEFQTFFQNRGKLRDQLHTALIFQSGLTRFQEGTTFKLSSKRVEPKIDKIIPINFPRVKKNLLFIVLDNHNAIFIDQSDMRCIHKLRFDQCYSVPMTKRFETKFNKMKVSPKVNNQPLTFPHSPIGKEGQAKGIETPDDFINLGSVKKDSALKMLASTTGERTQEAYKNPSEQKHASQKMEGFFGFEMQPQKQKNKFQLYSYAGSQKIKKQVDFPVNPNHQSDIDILSESIYSNTKKASVFDQLGKSNQFSLTLDHEAVPDLQNVAGLLSLFNDGGLGEYDFAKSSRDLAMTPLKSSVNHLKKLQNNIARDPRSRTINDRQNPFQSVQANKPPPIHTIKNKLQENIRIKQRLSVKSVEKSETTRVKLKAPLPIFQKVKPRRNILQDSIQFQRKYQVLGLEHPQGNEDEAQRVEQIKSRNQNFQTHQTDIPRELFTDKWERQELKASWDKCMKRINQEIKDAGIDEKNTGWVSNRRQSIQTIMQGIQDPNQIKEMTSIQVAQLKNAIQDYNDIDMSVFRSKELDTKIKMVCEKFKPNLDRIIAQMKDDPRKPFRNKTIEAQRRNPLFNGEHDIENDMTLSDCFYSPDRISLRHQELQVKLQDARKRINITQKLNQHDTKPFDDQQKRVHETMTATKKKKGEEKPKEEALVLQKFHKIQYAPGGRTDREEYQPKIPTVTTCAFDEDREVLVCCFVNCETKVFHLKGLDTQNNLKTTLFDKSYNGGFIPSSIDIGVHKVMHELVAIIAGEGQLHIINIEPISPRFMELIQSENLPKKEIDELAAKQQTFYPSERVENVSCIKFHPFIGVFVQFFRGFFKMFEPIGFKDVWTQICMNDKLRDKRIQAGDFKLDQVKELELKDIHPKTRMDISIVCADISQKYQFLALGGQQGNLMIYDVMSRCQFANNSNVHVNQEIVGLYFYDEESQLISVGKDRQISLWEVNNFECLQTIKDLDFEPNFFSSVCFLPQSKTVLAATFGIKQYKLNIDEKLRLKQLQMDAIVKQNQVMMTDMLLGEARKHQDTATGKIIYQQILEQSRKGSVIQDQTESPSGQGQITHLEKRPKDYGRVTMSKFTQVIQVETNFDLKGRNDSFEIYTIDSDFMIKIWDLNFRYPKDIEDDKFSRRGGRCKESIIMEPDPRYDRLISVADGFKNDLSRGAENLGAIKRRVICSDLIKRLRKNQLPKDQLDAEKEQDRMIALCDNAGILQVNNLNSGNLLFSLTNKRNKVMINCLHFINQGKLLIAGGGNDGSIVFFYRPPVDASKETQLEPGNDSYVVKRDIHRGEINHIDHSIEFIVFGGADNKLSIWKIMGQQLVQTIQLSGSPTTSICDFKFITINFVNSFILVMQNTGNFQLCQARNTNVVFKDVIKSKCVNGKFAISQATRLNENGLFVVDGEGRIGKTYKFEQHDKVARQVSFRFLHKSNKKNQASEDSLVSNSDDSELDKKKLAQKKIKFALHSQTRSLLHKMQKTGQKNPKQEADRPILNYKLMAHFEIQHIPDQLTVQPEKKKGKTLVKKDVRQDVDTCLSDIKIVGSGLCITAISTGLVSFYNFKSGKHLFDLNTNNLFPFLSIKKALYLKFDDEPSTTVKSPSGDEASEVDDEFLKQFSDCY